MQVILRDDVDHLGYRGDVVDVRKGYWRNYLRPKKLAETATSGRVTELQAKQERRREAEARNEDEAKELQSLLARTVLTIPANAGPTGKLFGSVTATDIAKSMESARKLRVDPKRIQLAEPIRELGTHMISIDVYAGVQAQVKTIVVATALGEDEIARLTTEAEAAERAAAEAEAAASAPAVETADETAETEAEVEAAYEQNDATAVAE